MWFPRNAGWVCSARVTERQGYLQAGPQRRERMEWAVSPICIGRFVRGGVSQGLKLPEKRLARTTEKQGFVVTSLNIRAVGVTRRRGIRLCSDNLCPVG